MPAMLSLTMIRQCSLASVSGETRTCGLGVPASYVDYPHALLIVLKYAYPGSFLAHVWRFEVRSVVPGFQPDL